MSLAECQYCGTQQTLPRLDSDRRVNIYLPIPLISLPLFQQPNSILAHILSPVLHLAFADRPFFAENLGCLLQLRQFSGSTPGDWRSFFRRLYQYI